MKSIILYFVKCISEFLYKASYSVYQNIIFSVNITKMVEPLSKIVLFKFFSHCCSNSCTFLVYTLSWASPPIHSFKVMTSLPLKLVTNLFTKFRINLLPVNTYIKECRSINKKCLREIYWIRTSGKQYCNVIAVELQPPLNLPIKFGYKILMLLNYVTDLCCAEMDIEYQYFSTSNATLCHSKVWRNKDPLCVSWSRERYINTKIAIT